MRKGKSMKQWVKSILDLQTSDIRIKKIENEASWTSKREKTN